MELAPILHYMIRIFPGILLAVLFLALTPRKAVPFRIFGYILIFILIRDAMTPAGFWSFGDEGFLWIRFTSSPLLLVLLGLGSACVVGIMLLTDRTLSSLVVWIKGHSLLSLLTGVAGTVAVILPLLAIYHFTPITERGGQVGTGMLIPLLVVALLGNFYEETLFRGFFQGYLEKVMEMPALRAAILSGVAFAFCHVFLALTVTGVGYPLLAFALYEGIIAGLVRMRAGTIPATITHGGAIFILSSGLV
ncbi:MAG: type II CAAX prenyl endopeptidase Rce1 family protein [Spirochaetota bacterium]